MDEKDFQSLREIRNKILPELVGMSKKHALFALCEILVVLAQDEKNPTEAIDNILNLIKIINNQMQEKLKFKKV